MILLTGATIVARVATKDVMTTAIATMTTTAWSLKRAEGAGGALLRKRQLDFSSTPVSSSVEQCSKSGTQMERSDPPRRYYFAQVNLKPFHWLQKIVIKSILKVRIRLCMWITWNCRRFNTQHILSMLQSERDFKEDVENFFNTASCTKFDDDIQDYYEGRSEDFQSRPRNRDSGAGGLSFRNLPVNTQPSLMTLSSAGGSSATTVSSTPGMLSSMISA